CDEDDLGKKGMFRKYHLPHGFSGAYSFLGGPLKGATISNVWEDQSVILASPILTRDNYAIFFSIVVWLPLLFFWLVIIKIVDAKAIVQTELKLNAPAKNLLDPGVEVGIIGGREIDECNVAWAWKLEHIFFWGGGGGGVATEIAF
ncbi:hypothetical protein ACJX0J_017047, partial [Zea mays]